MKSNRTAHQDISPRQELLQLQRSLFEKISHDIHDYLGRHSPTLLHYKKDYERDLTGYQRVSNKAELIREVLKSQIVYLGDYHTLRQAQRTVIKILRDVVREERRVILGVEMAHNEDQEHIDAYLAGRLSEKDFLENIQYRKTWNFEWPNYKQIFDFCHKFGIPIIGLNCAVCKGDQVLRKRDLVAAKIIASLHLDNPDALIFVFYGDLHICRQHIPRMVRHQLQKKHKNRARDLIIYQNSEELYQLLVSRGLEQKVDVLKVDANRYCVMNTPPWVKLQTYLNWLEHRSHDFSEGEEDLGEQEDTYQYYHRLWDMVDTIASFLKIRNQALDSFNIFTSGDIEFFDFLNSYLKTVSQQSSFATEMIRVEIIYNGTCLLAEEGMIYVSTLNINKFAEKIGQFIHAKTTGARLNYMSKKTAKEYYFGRILFEAIGYISSKIINFKRKCELPADFVQTLASYHGKRLSGRMQEQRHIARLVLRHFECTDLYLNKSTATKKWLLLYKQPARILFSVTQAIGQILGEHAYNAVINNRLDKAHIRHLFSSPITCNQDNQQLYFTLEGLVESSKKELSSKQDRF